MANFGMYASLTGLHMRQRIGGRDGAIGASTMSQLLRAITLASATVMCADHGAVRAQEPPAASVAPASAPTPPFPVTRPLQGHLSGAFAPDRFEYWVILTKVMFSQAGPGEHTTSFTSSDSGPDDSKSVKVGSDGHFDLGTVTIDEHNSLTVYAELRGGEMTGMSTVFKSTFVDPSKAQGWRGRFPPLDPAQESMELVLPVMSTVTLSTDDSVTAGKRVTFKVWDEHGGSEGPYTNGHCTLLKEAGSYLIQATLGDLASPFTTLVVGSDGAPVSAKLELSKCPPFRVQLTGGPVADGGLLFFVLGTDSLAETPLPCRVRFTCRDGVVELNHIVPGKYLVELQKVLTPVHRQQMELRPDAPPIALSKE